VSVLVVGSVAFDAIETPAGRVERTLGGAATYFSLAASLFAPVRLVGVVGEDFTDEHAAVFADRPIDTAGLERRPGRTFFWAGRYSEDFSQRTTLVTELNVFAEFRPRLPDGYRDCPLVFLGNIHPALQHQVLEQVRRPRLVALDTMNYWIEQTPAELARTLARADVLVVNDEEARQLAGRPSVRAAAEWILERGPQAVVIKRGEHGAMLVTRRELAVVPAYPVERVVDPTGAGDSFAGGFLGALAGRRRLDGRALRQALLYGAVLGSFAVEAFGVERLRGLTRAEVDQRARRLAALSRFRVP
jgi:sugar/nucleoside kinase (ribokinase family)